MKLVKTPIKDLATVCLAACYMSAAVAAEDRVDYNRDIRPILADNCYRCHGPDGRQREAGLRLDVDSVVGQRLESGHFAIVPGKPGQSALLTRIQTSDPGQRMPPTDSGKTLTPREMSLLERWIRQGARWQGHWAFQPVQRPQVPASADPQWGLNAIDRFVARRLAEQGLGPSQDASRESLIRRVTFDLTGLPPTLPEMDAFLADRRPGAYERLVDRLLASSRYGEQQARIWLDAARYGDTHGLHLDNERSIWPYRDWVVRAFNNNMPFDQFTVEQLAGDLLPSPTVAQRVATGFNRCNVTTSEGGAIKEEYRFKYGVDRVETTATVWLGLTMGCAVCHEHKFDPIPQKDFYRFLAYFNSLTERAMDGNALLPPPSVKVATPVQQADLDAHAARLAMIEQRIDDALSRIRYEDPGRESNPTKPGAPRRFASFSVWWRHVAKSGTGAPKPVVELARVPEKKRTKEQTASLLRHFLTHACRQTADTFLPLLAQQQRERDSIKAIKDKLASTLVMQDLKKPRQTFVLNRGQYDLPDKTRPVTPGTPAALPSLDAEAPANRLGLARWLMRPDHPLTARVTVNRYWQQFFGVGLVKTSEDFGAQGEWPSHPRLLDWLASEFIRSGWNVKAMHRLLVTSASYRQDTRFREKAVAKDPENRFIWRGPRFRLDAEVLRDSALAISGLLVEQPGGKGVRPYQPDGLWKAVGYTGSNTVKFVQDHGSQLFRRSLYTFWKRTAAPPTMLTFDAPSRESCSVRRARTNTPLQALLLLNDVQFFECARGLAEQLLRHGDDDRSRLVSGFRLVTSRHPTETEMTILQQALEQHRKEYQAHPADAAAMLAVGEAPRVGGLQPTELAAWTIVANLLLNLDEAITKG